MKNIVICAALNDESLNLLKSLKGSPLLEGANIHIVHAFEVHVYTSDFSPYVFPTEDKYPELEKASKDILNSLAKQICTDEQFKNVSNHVFFTQNPKQKIGEFLNEQKADLTIVATRGKHGMEGLFSSSFAEHLVKFSPCDVHILRPRK
jgi:nucleotide-binding universal stress UspA family protein